MNLSGLKRQVKLMQQNTVKEIRMILSSTELKQYISSPCTTLKSTVSNDGLQTVINREDY